MADAVFNLRAIIRRLVPERNAETLTDAFAKWSAWSRDADRTIDNWETNYPENYELIRVTAKTMRQADVSEQEFQCLEKIWSFSEEDEELLDLVKRDVDRSFAMLQRLTNSGDRQVRWQMYDAMSCGTCDLVKGTLWDGMSDEDSYCRRRAGLALCKACPDLTPKVVLRLMEEPDGYERMVAVRIAKEYSLELLETVQPRAMADRDPRVREELPGDSK